MNFKFATCAIVFASLLPTISVAAKTQANVIQGTQHYVVSPGTTLRAGEAGKNEFFIIGAQSNSVPHIERANEKSSVVTASSTVASKDNTAKLSKALKHAFHKTKSIANGSQKAFAKVRQPKKTLAKKHQVKKQVASKALKKKHIALKQHTKSVKHKMVAKKATHSHTLHG